MSQMLSPTTTARFDRRVQARGGGQEQVRIRLGVFDLIARHHWSYSGIDAERCEVDRRRLHAAAGGDRPWKSSVGQPGQQFAGAWQRANGGGHATIGLHMQMAQALELFFAEVHSGFALELIGEQAAAHADLAMDAPDRNVHAFRVQSLLPGQDVLVDAVDQRAVEIEQKNWLDAHRSGSSSGRGIRGH